MTAGTLGPLSPRAVFELRVGEGFSAGSLPSPYIMMFRESRLGQRRLGLGGTVFNSLPFGTLKSLSLRFFIQEVIGVELGLDSPREKLECNREVSPGLSKRETAIQTHCGTCALA